MHIDAAWTDRSCWREGVRIDEEWLRMEMPCCGEQVDVSLGALEGMDVWGLKVAHCNRGFTLVGGPFTEAGRVLWMEWTPGEDVVRPAA